MLFTSHKISLFLLAVTALVGSRIFFSFLNDPEGPNLLIVVGLALALYLLSLIVYLVPSLTNMKKLVLGILIQLVFGVVLYFFLK